MTNFNTYNLYIHAHITQCHITNFTNLIINEEEEKGVNELIREKFKSSGSLSDNPFEFELKYKYKLI